MTYNEQKTKSTPGNMIGWCAQNNYELGCKIEKLAHKIGLRNYESIENIPKDLENYLFDRAIDIAHEIDCNYSEYLSLDSDNFKIVYSRSEINGFECFGLFVSKGDLNLTEFQEMLSFSKNILRKIIKDSEVEEPLFFPTMISE